MVEDAGAAGLMLLDTWSGGDYMAERQPEPSRNDRTDGALPEYQWFVCQTEPQAEFAALRRVAALPGVKPWLVLEVRRRVLLRHGRPVFIGPQKQHEEVLRPFFTGYLLVSFDPDGEAYAPLLRWNRELRTRRLLTDPAYKPLPIAPGVVEDLQRQGRAGDGAIDLESLPVALFLKPGDEVRIAEGPFANRRAVVSWTDQQRVQVLLGTLKVSIGRGQIQAGAV